jgi:hypothetical protein
MIMPLKFLRVLLWLELLGNWELFYFDNNKTTKHMKTREFVAVLLAIMAFVSAYLCQDCGMKSIALWILIGYIVSYITVMMIIFVILDHDTSRKRSGKVNGGIEL